MITLQDSPRVYAASAAASPAPASAARTLLYGSLFITMLISPLVFIEPAPYEFGATLLIFCCILARVPFDRRILPLVLLLVVFNLGGIGAMVGVLDSDLTVRYVAISLFMALSAIVFACLFAEDDSRSLLVMRRAYIIAAVFAAMTGIAGYFNLFPGAADNFTMYSRARGTFKDPNVFGPCLILPILMLMQSLLGGRIRPRQLLALGVILFGLLVSFSRGAWFHCVMSAGCMIGLMFITAPDARTRGRLTLLTMVGIGVLAAAFVFALSFESLGEMFTTRAKLVQDYDAGNSVGRFNLQQLALSELLSNPFGLGPFEFQRLYGLQQHNTYLQAFLVYGWIGGLSYVVMILMTLAVGLRASLIRSHWQPYAITGLSAFAGVVAEGAVIDTDHWRHFFLLLGIVWGCYAASTRPVNA